MITNEFFNNKKIRGTLKNKSMNAMPITPYDYVHVKIINNNYR